MGRVKEKVLEIEDAKNCICKGRGWYEVPAFNEYTGKEDADYPQQIQCKKHYNLITNSK